MGQFLYGVRATDPLTYGTVAAVIVAVGALGSLIPARRAVKIDPTIALRCE
jgi:putative ABC transport system permease protein